MNTDAKSETSFRDKLSTIDEKGHRAWIYPQKPKGKLYNSRTIVSFFLLAFLFGAPFIKVHGQPLLLFNVLERKFIVFGLTFWPQDFFLFGLAMLTFIIFIVLFTVVFGRVFCGWACPQTIFLEMVFRKIEYWIEGDASQQRALNNAPLTQKKALKKSAKHLLFFGIAFLIGNTFLAYIIGIDELFQIVTSPPSANWAGFLSALAFSGVFYLNFAFFREQLCLVVCPYGRLQGVLLDKDSIVVAYDFVRGETRGKMKKEETRTHGDCIDCGLCVRVCPTGIDIRNGTQLECVNCTACIDACNEIMEKVSLPKNLIRYDSYNGISNKRKFKITPRIIAYSMVLTLLIAVLGFSLGSRADVETTILRQPGMLYQEVEGNKISNLYNIEVVNKTIKMIPIQLKLKSPEGVLRMVGNEFIVRGQGMAKTSFFVELPKEKLEGRKTELIIEVYSGEKLIDEIKTNFSGPFN